MTSAQRIHAIHLVGSQLAWSRQQAQRYRQLAADNAGERALNEAGARVCEQDADAWNALLEMICEEPKS